MEIEILDIEQNSPQWDKARSGLVTCSQFSTVLAKGKGGGPSVTRKRYLYQLAAERITGEPIESYSNGYMERGHELEPEAVAFYEGIKGVECTKVGFIRNGEVGGSPDRLIGEDGILEIKTRKGDLQIELLLDEQEVPSEHLPQIQGLLWVSNRQWCDFCCYSRGLPIFIKRVERDDKFINGTLWPSVSKFIEDLNLIIERLNDR